LYFGRDARWFELNAHAELGPPHAASLYSTSSHTPNF
jgi:hypothetical protein